MTGNKRFTAPDWVDEDDAPDLSAVAFRERLEATPVRRGRPKTETPKISTTLRLDADILEFYRATGPGWQGRINAALRATVKS